MVWTRLLMSSVIAGDACRSVNALEKELHSLGVNLKSLEMQEEHALQRENSYNDLLRSMESRLKEVQLI